MFVALVVAVGAVLSSSTGVLTAAADDGDLVFTSSPVPTIVYRAIVGMQTRVGALAWTPVPTTVTYQWFDDGVPIVGATDATYTPLASERGASLTVAATGALAGYAPLTETSAPQVVVGVPTTTGVTISGGALPGDIITSDVGTWTPANSVLKYVWFTGSSSGFSDTGPTYATTEADAGSSIYLEVDAYADGWWHTYARSNTITVGYDHIFTQSGFIRPDVMVGQTVIIYLNQWQPSWIVFSYQWMSDGSEIAGATSSTYVARPEDAGHKLSVTVTGTAPGLPPASITLGPTSPVKLAFLSTPPPIISGTPRLGETLTTSEPVWTPVGTTYSFGWSVGGSPQPNSGSAFTPTDPSFVGKTVTVSVVESSATSGPGVSTSTATRPIAPGIADVSHVKIGAAHLNETVTATTVGVPATAPIDYQWTIDGVVIPGAVSRTYLPQPSDYGKQLRVIASVAGGADGYLPSNGTSNAQTVRSGQFDVGGTIISGAPRVGSTLTATSVGWGVPGVHVRYEWFSSKDELMILSTSNSYTVRPSDLGQVIYGLSQASLAHYATFDGWIGDAVGPIGPGRFATAPTVTITGSASVGSALTAHHTSASPSTAVSYRYQWYSQSSASATPVAISRATGMNYTIPASQGGRILSVRVTASKSAYASSVGTSAETPTVIGLRPPASRTRVR
jgi:hypothetical protein